MVDEFHALQYGVSRDELATVLADRRLGRDPFVRSRAHQLLVLETGDGGPDPVSADEVAQVVLEGAVYSSRRPGLVVISTCQSAADAADRSPVSAGMDPLAPSAAMVLSERLQAGVVGMRYPVSDRFARTWAVRFYRRLGEGAVLGVAAAAAVGG
jgi:CHAT domain-containing protein